MPQHLGLGPVEHVDPGRDAQLDAGTDFVEFRAEIRALTGVAKLAFTTLGLAAIAGALGVAFSVARLGAQVDNLSTRLGVIETRFERIAPPTVAPPAAQEPPAGG